MRLAIVETFLRARCENEKQYGEYHTKQVIIEILIRCSVTFRLSQTKGLPGVWGETESRRRASEKPEESVLVGWRFTQETNVVTTSPTAFNEPTMPCSTPWTL